MSPFSYILGDAIVEALELSRELEDAPTLVLNAKLSEEFGELSEALLKEMGYLQHKTLKESSISEAADIINVLLAVLSAHYPDKSVDDIIRELRDAIVLKCAKYRDILENKNA